MKPIPANKIKFSFLKLNPKYLAYLNDFSCGNVEIDNKLRESLEDSQIVSFLVFDGDPDDTSNNAKLVGVYSLSCSGFIYRFNEKMYIYPAVEIKYFAIDKRYQDRPFSDDPDDGCISNMILYKVIAQVFDFTENYCGADKIILYSTPNAVEFYKKAGFEDFKEYMLKSSDRFLNGCTPMYLNLL